MIRHGFALLIQVASWKDLLREGESRKHFIRLHALTRRLLANTASARLEWRCENDMRAFSEAEWADGHEAIGAPRHRAWNWKQEIPLCRPKGGIRSFAKDNLMYVARGVRAPPNRSRELFRSNNCRKIYSRPAGCLFILNGIPSESNGNFLLLLSFSSSDPFFLKVLSKDSCSNTPKPSVVREKLAAVEEKNDIRPRN